MKTRFAPSPTGYLHLGNIRTALFNALLANHANGIFLLRIEDTDQTRSATEFVTQLEADLNWLGLYWQEGPTIGGQYAPYFQSQRQTIYNDYYDRLQKAGLVYPCYCSDQELAIARKVQLTAGRPPRYQGTCCHLTAAQIAQKESQGVKPTLRFRVPENQTVMFDDFVRGAQTFQTNEIGDFIICRSDRTPAFFFCNAIDDALMEVTHVLRGEDHLTNTPRQLLLLRALKLREPQYGHVPLIVGQDGSPLSKRHGSRSIKELRELGYLPSALINYMARLGHYYSDNAYMDFAQLAAQFTLSAIGTAPAHFDADQLLYWQKQAAHHLQEDDLWQWLGKPVQDLIPASVKTQFIAVVRSNIIFPADAQYWARILFDKNSFQEASFYRPDAVVILKQAGTAYLEAALKAVEEHGANFAAISQTLQQKIGVKGKALFQPMRIALTGELHGPEMAPLVELLGVDKIRMRLQQAMRCIAG